MHSLSQSELRKLGVMMEKRMSGGFDSARVRPDHRSGRNDRCSSGLVLVDAAGFAGMPVATRLGHSAPAAGRLRGCLRFAEGGMTIFACRQANIFCSYHLARGQERAARAG